MRQGTLDIVIEEVLWSIRGSYQTNMKFPSHKCLMTFYVLIIYNDNPLLIRLCTELDLLPNFECIQYNICDGCGMPTGDAYSSGHLVPSLWDLHMLYLLRPILFRTCRYFSSDYALRISLGTIDFASYFSMLLYNTFVKLLKYLSLFAICCQIFIFSRTPG